VRRVAFGLLNGRNELIAALGKSPNIAGGRRIVIEGQANLSNAKVKPAIEIYEYLGAPNCAT